MKSCAAWGIWPPAAASWERAAASREARLDPDHPATAQSLNNLAVVLRDQGDLGDALTLHERALAIWETRLGPDHPYTAGGLNGHGVVLRAQGDLVTARRVLECAVAIRETRLGPDHRHTATSLSNLAEVLRDQGELEMLAPCTSAPWPSASSAWALTTPTPPEASGTLPQ